MPAAISSSVGDLTHEQQDTCERGTSEKNLPIDIIGTEFVFLDRILECRLNVRIRPRIGTVDTLFEPCNVDVRLGIVVYHLAIYRRK